MYFCMLQFICVRFSFLGFFCYRTQWTAEGSVFLRRQSVVSLFVYEIRRELLNGFAPNSHGRRVWSLAQHFSVLSAACMQFMFGKTSSASSVIVYLCMFAFVVLVFSTMPRDWLGRTSPKWSILCGVGRKSLTYILAIGWCVCDSLWHIIASGRYVCITSCVNDENIDFYECFAHFSHSVVGDRKFVDHYWWARSWDLNLRWFWTCLGNCRVCLPLFVFHTCVHTYVSL